MFEKRTLIGSSIIPIRFVFFMWLIFVLDQNYGYELANFGLLPRTTKGLIGIITAPYIHASLFHLVSNTIPLLFLGITLFYNFHRIARNVFYSCYFLTNLLVWLFARPSMHVGASGLIYGLATFSIFFGLFRRDFKSLLVSAIVLLFYGSIFYGIIPTDGYISWESHLFGSLVGVILAAYYSKNKKV